MPYRMIPLVTGEYYHVFNRGVAKLPIFLNKRDYVRFTHTFIYYSSDGTKQKFSAITQGALSLQSDKIVDIIAYCLMPNHFHLLLRQKKDNGISHFIRNVSNSYTKYFNVKNGRVGPLLQGPFKAIHIELIEQLLHVSRYIHLNPTVGYIVKRLEDYPWSSFREYIGISINNCCQKEEILQQFSNTNTYKQFVLDQQEYAKKLHLIKHLLIDFEE